jgi:hypothetical protein
MWLELVKKEAVDRYSERNVVPSADGRVAPTFGMRVSLVFCREPAARTVERSGILLHPASAAET